MESLLRAVVRLLTAIDRFDVYLHDFPDDPKEDASLVQGLFDASGEAMYTLEQLGSEPRQLLSQVILALHSEEQQTQVRAEVLGHLRRLQEDLDLPVIPGPDRDDLPDEENAEPRNQADQR